MEKLFKTLSDYYNRPDFRKFQNNLAKEVYETLGTSYSNSDGEVKMVTDMCQTINGKSFGQLSFHTKKIHGSRSYVEFSNQDKPSTKELADMVIISVATKQQEIIYEKVAFVQNKKESSDYNWKIDQDQLYLLHNFPTFKGTKGIFKRNFGGDVVFLNHSETLGNYGLFQSPGEMIFVNAKTVYKLQQGNSISLSDIRKFNDNNYPSYYFHEYDFPVNYFPFLSSCKVAFNIYELIRNWTYFNIGEVASRFGKIIDKDLSNFTRLLLRETDLTNVINLNVEEQEFENNLTILVAHLNLDNKE